ncbi:MAG: hypothetical protein EBZ77_16930, partial [Chitinophagia bacterium]|nr:hypothetical protein [Chitinophagia bacterium]
TAVSFFYNRNLGVDFSGNLYIDCLKYIKKVSASGVFSTVITSANGGNFVGINGPATAAGYFSTGLSGSSMWVDSAGQVFYVDSCGCIRRIGTDGVVRIVAGRSCSDTSFIDGAAATATGLGGIFCITTDAAGNIYFTTSTIATSSSLAGRVAKVGTDGVFHVLAGVRSTGYTTDGAPATSAALSGYMRGIAIDKDSNLYFSESQRRTTGQTGLIRKISKTGILTSVAGILDSPGFSGDGGPATAAKLGYDVTQMAISPNGDLYFIDVNNYCVRVIKRSTLQVENATPLSLARMSIAPNPASEGAFVLRCKSGGQVEEMDVTITALDGRQLLRLRGNTRDPLPIHLPNKGTYLVTADLPGQRITQRVVVE